MNCLRFLPPVDQRQGLDHVLRVQQLSTATRGGNRWTSADSGGQMASDQRQVFGSYGRQNRQAIAARETRIAARLRAVEHAYQAATDPGTSFNPPELIGAPRTSAPMADREVELE